MMDDGGEFLRPACGTAQGDRGCVGVANGSACDIFHRTLAIEENARFEGTSRRQENTTDTPLPVAQAVPMDGNRKGNGAPDGLNA